jgi:WD40 repeat protein
MRVLLILSALALAALCTTHVAAQQVGPDESVRIDNYGDPLPPGAIQRLGSRRWRPGGAIWQLAFSPDGKRLASWHEEHHTSAALTVWSVADGREERRIEAAGLGVSNLTWLPDGRGVASANASSGRYIWDFTDATSALPHKPPTWKNGAKKAIGGPMPDNEDLSGFAISPDGKYLVAGKSGAHTDKERDIVAWDLATQRKIADLPKPRRVAVASGNCYDLYFTPDSRKLVVLCQPVDSKRQLKEFVVAVFDVASGKRLRRFTAPAPIQQGRRKSLALSPTQLAFGMEDEKGTVLLWKLDPSDDEGPDRRLLSGHGKRSNHSGYGVSALTFSEDGKRLITAGRDGMVRVWDAATIKELRAIKDAYPGWIEIVALTRDGKRLACAGQDGIIRHWDVTTGAALDDSADHGGRVTGVSVTPDGATALTAAADGRLRVWDVQSGRELRSIAVADGTRGWPFTVLAPDGRTVLVAVGEHIKAWSVDRGNEVPLPESLVKLGARWVQFENDGRTLLSIQKDKVNLFDWPSGKPRRDFTLPEPLNKPGETHCVSASLSPDGRWLATLAHRSWHREDRGMRFGYAADYVLDLWNATTGERVHRLMDGGSRSVMFTADGDLLVSGKGTLHPRSGGADVELSGEFHLIDPVTGRLKQLFEPAPVLPGAMHRYNAAMGIAPDGRSIFCSGNDGVIHIYETATGKIRRSLTRHRDYVMALACTKDGRRLVTASTDVTALVWDISLSGIVPKNAAPSDPAEQAKQWNALESPDAKSAYAAMAMLGRHPKTAISLIRAHVKPVTGSPNDAVLDRLVAELNDERFDVRAKATKELDQLGEAVVPGMRTRVGKAPSLETERRLIQFLEKYDPVAISPARLREIRALELLEQLMPASREALAELAQGAPNARITRAAAAALARQK